jgi:spore coat protein A, manganese oxidase
MASISRREVLKLGAYVGGVTFIPLALQRIALGADQISAQIPPRYKLPFKFPPLSNPVKTVGISAGNPSPYGTTGDAGGLLEPIANAATRSRDVHKVDIKRASVDMLGNGQKTEIWGYNGITPGPTVKVKLGVETLVRFNNVIDRADAFGNTVYTSVHTHGMASLPPFDGWADDITLPGEGKDYYYPNNRPATLWYHDHGVHRTAYNAYQGLTGAYIVEDPNEVAGIPKTYGVDDFPLIIADKIFDAAGQLVFDEKLVNNSGYHGDVILVNGAPWPTMTVEPKPYRFRAVSPGVSRAYNLYLSNGGDLQVIGTDAGLLEKAAPTQRLRIGVAERYEFIIDFSKYAGQTFELKNAGLKNHPDYLHTDKVMQFKVKAALSPGVTFNRTAYSAALAKLRNDTFNYDSRIARLRAFGQANGGIVQRTMTFERSGGRWVINGRVWGDGVNPFEGNPRLNGVEIWRLKNGGGGWNHPVHIHLVDFLMISRTGGDSPGIRNYEKGFKDVVYLGEGEEIEVISIWGPHPGKYMFHCHNLIHEDDDMMRAFNVAGKGVEPVGTDGTFRTRGQGPYDAKPIGQLKPL